METVEKLYRDTPAENKKYAKRLTDYIVCLMKRGRILEAKIFFDQLNKVKPHHSKTIRLGYSLSISLFDSSGIKIYDELLYKSKPTDIELMWFRLRYYHSINDLRRSEETCKYLLSKKVRGEYLTTIIEVCIRQESYPIAEILITFLEDEKLQLSIDGSMQVKKIIMTKLIETISRSKND